MSHTFTVNNDTITMSIMEDVITIQLLDSDLHKLYSEKFCINNIVDYCMNLSIFTTVLLTTFSAWVNNDTDKAELKIIKNDKNLVLIINHKHYINFEFELILGCSVNSEYDSKDALIEQLRKNIKDLSLKQQEMIQYQEILIDMMEINIISSLQFSYGNNTFGPPCKYKNNKITINFGTSTNVYEYQAIQYTCNWTPENTNIQINNTTKFNSNFKNVLCSELILNTFNNSFDKFAGVVENIPCKINKIVIVGNGSAKFFNFIKTNNTFTNLKCIELKNTSDILTIYDNIKHIGIKKVILTNVTGFTDKSVLTLNKINVETS